MRKLVVYISLQSSLMAGSTQLAWMEALYKRNLLNKLNSLAKNIRFLRFCKQIVFAQLELSGNGLENF